MGIDAYPAVPRLIRLLDDPDVRTRAAAVDALGAVGKDATAAIPKLAAFLADGELPRVMTEVSSAYSAIGIRASLTLGQMGSDAVPSRVMALADNRSAARSNAACALQQIGPAAQAATPALLRLLEDRDELVREQAIWALRAIRPDSSETTAALSACMRDTNSNIRAATINALGTIRPVTPEAVELLVRALHDEDGNVQHEAATRLGELGDDARPAIPALAELLKSRAYYLYGHPALERPLSASEIQPNRQSRRSADSYRRTRALFAKQRLSRSRKWSDNELR